MSEEKENKTKRFLSKKEVSKFEEKEKKEKKKTKMLRKTQKSDWWKCDK